MGEERGKKEREKVVVPLHVDLTLVYDLHALTFFFLLVFHYSL
jgi:hypothetical protein